MREHAVINDEIRSLQEEINLLLGQKGFMEYDRILSLSQKLDEIINEWIRIKGFAHPAKRMELKKI